MTQTAIPDKESSQALGIHVDSLIRHFGAVKAVDGITFDAPAGAVTALIGPNGSGKTTLLLILAGLLAPDSGEASVAGLDVVHDARARGRIGWMPDVFGTWDALTCLEILTIFGQAYGMNKKHAVAKAAELLERSYLDEFASLPARVLSRGQKQRLGLARALVHDPDVLLLDEPASGLDPRSRVDLRDMLRSLAAEGKTVLVSSHVLSELEEVYDHAVFLSQGKTIDTGEPDGNEVRRGWRLEALDPASLRRFLDSADIPYKEGNRTGEVVVSLASYESAAELFKAAVLAGVALYSVAPTSGRLEETYLSLDEERK
ncbi:MAG: ABC transporter ATP-binding protein [Propionibacteriaceae bacterium]|jgi:ABC-type multidrug transport system ATPase subunit|nr:ABC transporter ATP-binding protein [Propionibacteriaceae bacterium]